MADDGKSSETNEKISKVKARNIATPDNFECDPCCTSPNSNEDPTLIVRGNRVINTTLHTDVYSVTSRQDN